VSKRITALTVTIAVAMMAGGVPALLAGDAPSSSRVWIGAFVEDVDGGIELVGIVPGGPSDRGGLEQGDILVGAGERDLAGLPDLEAVLATLRPGDSVQVRLLRGGEPVEVVLRVGRREARLHPAGPTPPLPPLPAPRPAGPVDDEQIGWVIVDVTPDLRAYFGAPAEKGVLVAGVASGRAAESAGLRVGDVVVALGEREVSDVDQVAQVLRARAEADGRLTVSIVRSRREQAITLALPELPPAAAPAVSSRARGNRAILERVIRGEIERLERRIEELREQLDDLRE